MPPLSPCRLQLPPQPLKRQLLVLICLQRSASHPLHQLTETRIAAHVRPQDHRVYKKADLLFQLLFIPSRHHRPNRNILPRSQPIQQRSQPRLQHHEQTRSTPPPQCQQPTMQSLIQLQSHRPARITHLSASLTVHRQLHLFPHSCKRPLPVLQLPPHYTPCFLPTPQHLPLPHRVIAILHSQTLPPRGSSFHPRSIRLLHIPRQRPQ